MNIVAIDDEYLALESLKNAIEQARPQANINVFRDAEELLEHIKKNECDLAFLDIEMRVNGIELAKQLKVINPKINIVFVTGYSQYMGEAFALHASGYLLKPATKEAVEEEINNLRYFEQNTKAHVRIQTFGNFEVFADGVPVPFKRSKSKELLALLVDKNGAGLSTAEIATVLWEEREYTRSLKNQVQNIIISMQEALTDAGIEDIVLKNWNSLSLDVSKVDCDYYRFMEGDAAGINAFKGEYMSSYSWAEFTTGYLSNQE